MGKRKGKLAIMPDRVDRRPIYKWTTVTVIIDNQVTRQGVG
jgi:hypothetical protein